MIVKPSTILRVLCLGLGIFLTAWPGCAAPPAQPAPTTDSTPQTLATVPYRPIESILPPGGAVAMTGQTEATPAAGANTAATPAPASAPAARAARTHRVQPGETLSRIAAHYYGDASQWRRIHEANRGIIPDPNRLTVGMELHIP